MDALGDYQILKSLGHGPLGIVYLAEHRFIKKLFVLKALPAKICEDAAFIRRFESQVAAIATLDHPNILKIHNVSCQDGVYFVVTDPVLDSFSNAMHLDRFLQLKGKTLSEQEIEKFLRQIAEALDFAHEAGVVHGSLKMTNVLVAETQNGVQPLLSDFALTRLVGEGLSLVHLCQQIADAFATLSSASSEQVMQNGQNFIRSLAFLAPEQKEFDGRIADAKVDAYAFGVLSYYVLLRKLPEGNFDLPSKALPDYQNNWDLFINRCLQNNPNVRPQKITLAMHEYLRAPRSLPKEMVSLAECESKLDSVNQLAFEFPVKAAVREAAPIVREMPKAPAVEEGLKPVFKPSEIARPEYDPDPGAIFHRDVSVSHYTPQQVVGVEIEPLFTEMVVIPGGSYARGSNEGARDEMPQHEVRLKSFALDVHPVTNEQFVRFLQVMGGEKDHNNNDIIRLRDSRIKRTAGKIIIESGYAKHPVTGVTWYGAVAYAKWIGKRLPTEAEWEAAASGGQTSLLYPTGNEIERSQANFFNADTTAVMSYPPNGFGLYDMAGNVYEWCQDWYAYNYYDTSALEPENPTGPQQGVYRVLRGGCWKSLKDDMRCAHRHRNNPGAVNGTYGFRCAADVVDPLRN